MFVVSMAAAKIPMSKRIWIKDIIGLPHRFQIYLTAIQIAISKIRTVIPNRLLCGYYFSPSTREITIYFALH